MVFHITVLRGFTVEDAAAAAGKPDCGPHALHPFSTLRGSKVAMSQFLEEDRALVEIRVKSPGALYEVTQGCEKENLELVEKPWYGSKRMKSWENVDMKFHPCHFGAKN